MPRHDDPDLPIRLAAFQALERLTAVHGSILPYTALNQGFAADGQSIHFMTRAQGIFKPKQMRSALSLLSFTHVRPGRLSRYADAETDHGFRYDLRNGPIEGASNRALLDAHAMGAPVIYFQSVAPGHYAAIWPAYIVDVDLQARVCHVVADDRASIRDQVEGILDTGANLRRRYATYEARRRLHQADFRHHVLHAYGCRCGICGLPEQRLIDAAHIVGDSNPLGEPVVPNGVALCRLHHGAFDAQLLGIRPDFQIVIADQLLAMTDGPTLRHGLQGFHEKAMRLPRNDANRPGQVYLAARWDEFKDVNRDRAPVLLLG